MTSHQVNATGTLKVLLSVVVAVGLLVSGAFDFRRMEKIFADRV